MGYTTEFEGILKFTKPLTAEEELLLLTICDDSYDRPEERDDWIKTEGENLSYIQYVIAPDKSGIQWNGGEKFYYAENACNLIIRTMQAKFPDFGLEGSLRAQGEEISDLWDLTIVNGLAVRKELLKPEDIVICPHCKEKFLLKDAK
jgi:hypothetical protein